MKHGTIFRNVTGQHVTGAISRQVDSRWSIPPRLATAAEVGPLDLAVISVAAGFGAPTAGAQLVDVAPVHHDLMISPLTLGSITTGMSLQQVREALRGRVSLSTAQPGWELQSGRRLQLRYALHAHGHTRQWRHRGDPRHERSWMPGGGRSQFRQILWRHAPLPRSRPFRRGLRP